MTGRDEVVLQGILEDLLAQYGMYGVLAALAAAARGRASQALRVREAQSAIDWRRVGEQIAGVRDGVQMARLTARGAR